jgi:hypothetical protein
MKRRNMIVTEELSTTQSKLHPIEKKLVEPLLTIEILRLEKGI